MKGYAIHHRIEKIEKKLIEHDQTFDMLLKTSLPPNQGIFYDGQIFDAYSFVSSLIKSAQTSIVLVDNYIDESVLMLLAKRSQQVSATLYTPVISKQLQLDLNKLNAQYQPVEIKTFNKSHDRFLVIDHKIVYHFGASLKDLGKKWFAFSKMELEADDIIKRLEKDKKNRPH